MKRITLFAVAVGILAGVVAFRTPASGQTDLDATPIYGIKIPSGYRDWPLISVARVGGPVNDIRAKLGNDVAMRAFRAGTNPFPDGTVIARLAWTQVTSDENNAALRSAMLSQRLSPDVIQKVLSESSVAGSPTNVQFMVKDSKKYASAGGWGFAQFTNGKPDAEAVHKTCFPCHAPAKDRDFVFTHYSH
ncbi:MAG TPA: cytochrome P460 family protein [Bryobacteraceae bacterium]|nr:cytochrome P460 family protein [Bryobacteraceae bacterium]